MRRDDTLLLNHEFLRERIRLLGLKHEWMSNRLLVHRRTVSRWVNGQTTRISRHNAERLVQLLECTQGELIRPDEFAPVGSNSAKRAALEELLHADLLSIAAPSGSWRMVETIIRANLYADMPVTLLGEVYNVLAVSLWRQARLHESRDAASRAIDIGKQIDNASIVTRALFTLGTVASLSGKHTAALEYYLRISEPGRDFAGVADLAAYRNNLAMVHRDRGELDKALPLISSAVELYESEHRWFNASIARHCRGIILTESGRWVAARSDLELAVDYARRSGSMLKVRRVDLFRADTLALTGRLEDAARIVRTHTDVFRSADFRDTQEHEIVARFFRLDGDYPKAREWLGRGHQATGPDSVERGFLLQEESRLCSVAGDVEAAARASELANQLFARTGIPGRSRVPPLAEYGSKPRNL